jgi:CheY-like chemotaxis protein
MVPGMRVLLIEDDPSSRDLAKRIIETQGHSVVTAGDGREGLRLAQADRPELIVLDLNLPDLPGWIVASQLRADEGLRDTPIIAVSAGGADDRDRAMAAGCSDFVSKPYDLGAFRAAIDLQRARLERAK